MAENRIYIFAYDIVSDASRHVIAKILEKRGVRVQGSVFEVRETHEGAIRIVNEIKGYMSLGDSLRVYPLPLHLLPQCIVLGGSPIAEKEEFFLL